jgi:SpoVK/Ycf46/Vps4 family AAA+-type ATPase
MFIRARTKKLKNGTISVTYQVVKKYRQCGKERQDVVSIGKSTNIKEALDEELRFLERMRKDLEVPITDYKRMIWKRGTGFVLVPVSDKEAEKMRSKLLKQYKKMGNKVAKLESFASLASWS